MNGKIRVSIVATSLKGSTISPEPRPILNVVNGSNNKQNFSENLFSKNNIEKNFVNSIDGANALKLEESFEIKSIEEQNSLIDDYENSEEGKIQKEAVSHSDVGNEIPNGLSIENASYMENNSDVKIREEISSQKINSSENYNEEQTPKLFSEEIKEESNEKDFEAVNETDQLFENDNSEEEDFEIPAFLRRQKF